MRVIIQATAFAAALSMTASTLAWSQVQAPSASPPPVVAPVVAPVTVAPGSTLLIPEGTQVSIRFDDDLSSKTATQGDRFSISLQDSIVLSDGFTIPAGYRGVGEVTNAQRSGMMGKGGELNVRFEYITIGNTRVRLRGSQGREGQGAMGATIALTVLFGPLGLLMKGKNIEIKRGQVITAYTDQPVSVPLPLAAPPAG